MRRFLAAALTCALLLPASVVLADPAPAVMDPGPVTATTLSLADIFLFVEPYILAVIQGVVLPLLLGYLAVLARKWLGVTITQQAQDAIGAAASTVAGRIMASQEPRFATMQIHVHSPIVQNAVPIAAELAKGAVEKLGLTPDNVAAMIAGEIGHLQAHALSVPVAPAAAPSTEPKS